MDEAGTPLAAPRRQAAAAGLKRRRVPWWVLWLAALVACVAGAVRAPSSWWGVAGLVAFGGLMASLRAWVPASYRDGWPRATVLTAIAAALGGGSYAFAVAPFGPRPAVSVVLGLLLLAALGGTAGSGVVGPRQGKYEQYRIAAAQGERLSALRRR
jgi:FtsH-binding integral membrane protein